MKNEIIIITKDGANKIAKDTKDKLFFVVHSWYESTN